VLRPIAAGLEARGLLVGPLLEEVGEAPDVLSDPDARVPHGAAVQLWLAAARATRDPFFGLYAAQTLRPGTLDVVDYAARASTTLEQGYRCHLRFTRLNHDVARMTLERRADHAWMTHALPGGRVLPRPPADFLAGAWVVLGRQMTGVHWCPTEVRFPHARPGDLSEYRRFFGDATLRFGEGGISMLLPAQLLDLPLVEANPGLCEVLVRHATDLLERMPATERFTDRVRELIVAELQGGDPSAEAIARRLRMSASTLHRRLRDAGTSHRQLRDALRAELAERYLAEPGVSVTEVAFMLGFSEASAFHRAFKRWTGKTPVAFRQASAARP
jgi:AraC-like DNA-binding protein